ncbi:hypothetical protein [Sutcliffiella horikoshii]|uniref:hypothetical protein n=1 Tax=Sutcliffiella horikoshii TaxID=79883 RepID=UPI003CF68FC5
MIHAERLQVFLSIPGRNLPPSEKFIIAKVNNGKQTHTFKFGRNCSIRHINEQIPKLVADLDFEQRRKEGVNRCREGRIAI